MPIPLDHTTLQMALSGFEAERQKVQAKIAELQRQLNGRARSAGTPVAATLTSRAGGA